MILWDNRRICGPSLTETSLCGAWLYGYTENRITGGSHRCRNFVC